MSQTNKALLLAAATKGGTLCLMAPPLALADDKCGLHVELMLWLCAVQDMKMSHTIMVSLLAAVTALCLMAPLALADDNSGLPSAWRTGIATNYGGAQDGKVCSCILHTLSAWQCHLYTLMHSYDVPHRQFVLSGYTQHWAATSGGW